MNVLEVLQSLKKVEDNIGKDKTFRKIKEYFKELSKKEVKKELGDDELEFLTNFVRYTDTYSTFDREQSQSLNFIQFDCINVPLFESVLKQYNYSLSIFLHNHCNFRSLLLKQSKYDINKSNAIGTLFRVINKYFEENPTTDRYKIIPMMMTLEKVMDLKSYTTFTVDKKARGDMNLIKYFFSNETYLTNSQAFWFVFEKLWHLFDLNNHYS
jgi:hypothetical protein